MLTHINQINPYDFMNWAENNPLKECGVSMDALFVGYCVFAANRNPNEKQPYQSVVPESFLQAVESNLGKSMTVSEIFAISFNRCPDAMNVREAGQWLRELGKQRRRAGGKLLYDL